MTLNSGDADGISIQWYESNASDEALRWICDWISPHRVDSIRDEFMTLKELRRLLALEELARGQSTRSLEGLPGRVLDIEPFPGATSVRLAPGKDLLRKDYVTLSYTWGADHPAMLTKDRLEAWKHEIPPESLTKTFTDAIWVTRRLKVRYLWIDAFCIVQNDDRE